MLHLTVCDIGACVKPMHLLAMRGAGRAPHGNHRLNITDYKETDMSTVKMMATVRKLLRMTFLCGLAIGMWAFATAGPAMAGLPLDKVTGFAIPRMSAPPQIDGSIDPVEWREATAIAGVVDQGTDILLPRPTTFYLAWDSEHLYLACRTYMPSGYKPHIHDGRSQGLANCFDDGLELLLHPRGQNVNSGNRENAFRMNLNALGYDGELTRLAVGQLIKNWQPAFTCKTRVTPPGSAPNGGSWWELEASASLADFELTGPHKAGDQWRFMLGINHFPGWMQARIPCHGGYFVSDGKNVGTLVENTPAVQLTMDSLHNLASDGTASMTVKAYNPARQEVKLAININVAGKIVKNETLLVPAGGEARYNLNEKLPTDVTSGLVDLRVTHNDTSLLTYSASFKVGESPQTIATPPARDPNKFGFVSTFNPLRELLVVKGDAYYLPDPRQAKALTYTVTAEGATKPYVSGTIENMAEFYFTEVRKLDAIKPGKYKVEAWLELKDGQRLGPDSAAIEKKDEAKAFPQWWGKKFGDIERVLSPFTAIIRKGNTFSCWGREYTLNALGLPAGLRSQGEALIAAPARIVVVVNGKEEVVKLGAPTITEATDWRIRFEGKAAGAGLVFSAKGWLEQDGLVYVDLTYRPQGDQPVQVSALRLEFPVAEMDADGLLCVGPGNNYAAEMAIQLPKDKQGHLWSTLDLGRAGSRMRLGSFYPTVWIGSDRRGFLWWADTDRGWFPDDNVPAHEVLRAGGEVVLRNNIIGKPVALTEARTISLSYMASPFKPLPKGWRSFAATSDGTFGPPFRGVRKDSKTGQPFVIPPGGNVNYIHPESRYPEEWPALWAEQKQGADAWYRRFRYTDPWTSRHGVNFTHMSFQLMGYGHKSLEDDVFNYFGDEWYTGSGDTWNSTYIDYAMYLFDQAFREGGVRNTYWDLTFPILFHSQLSGLAYRLPDGSIQPGYNSWNVRRFFMRLWALQQDYGLNPGAVGSHSTHAYVMCALPWLDAVLDGERDWDLDVSDRDWIDYYPVERMRTMACSHNWGVSITWMSYLASHDVTKVVKAKRTSAEYLWLFDSWCNPELCAHSASPAYRYLPFEVFRMPTAVLDWGINSEQTVYHSFWRNPFVTGQDKDVLVSLWQLPDRILIEVFNYNRKDTKDVTLKIDLDTLKLMPQLPWQEFVGVRDIYKDEKDASATLDVESRAITVKALAPHRGRLIGIRRY
ncbi:MAG: hypothetical protein IT440_07365 [Phycisphaeraceae bacterium]|nr:hypothetical protein [Phycisphaeraceae bacterium]